MFLVSMRISKNLHIIPFFFPQLETPRHYFGEVNGVFGLNWAAYMIIIMVTAR